MAKRLLLLFLLPLLVSCKKHDYTPGTSILTFNNVVILGNSITFAPHNTETGWYGDWGMAATSEDLDYVHILTRYFRVKNPDVTVTVRNIGAFEVDAISYDFDTNLKDLRVLKPDLLILRIGEDVPKYADLQVFDERYTALINYFKAVNPHIIILSVGSVWGSHVDPLMQSHPPYVLLSSMINDMTNFSFGMWTSFGIELHPCNKGMQNIAARLWDKISAFTENDRK